MSAPDDTDELITLADYASREGMSLRTAQRRVTEGLLPHVKDPTSPGRVLVSMGMVRRIQAAAAAKAEREFLQRNRLLEA